MKHYIGIDGGGTQSRLLCVDEYGKEICTVYGGATNISASSVEQVAENLKLLFDDLYSKCNCNISQCLGIGIGTAGVDNDFQAKIVEGILHDIGFACTCKVQNDSILPILANAKQKSGIAVISGTGSVACGINLDGEIFRAGGWGHIFDDGGSGYWMGVKALEYAYRAYDGRGIDTILVEMFQKHFDKTQLEDCIDIIYTEYSDDKSKIAQFSKMVSLGAKQGDKLCLDILDKAADELAQLVFAIAPKLNTDSIDIIATGGNLLNNDILYDMFVSKISNIYSNFNISRPHIDAVWGAVKMVM